MVQVIVYKLDNLINKDKLKQRCLLMNIELIVIDDLFLKIKIKDILNKKGRKTKNKALDYPLVVFSNAPSKVLDELVACLKGDMCLKAIVTATNYNWTFAYLYEHILEEYQKNR